MNNIAVSVSPWQRLWGAYVRWTARYPALASLVPFVPVVALWAAVAGAGIFPRVFFPGPIEVVQKFGTLMANGILPAYLEDSVLRLAVGTAMGLALGIPMGLLVGLSDRAHRALWPVPLFFQAIGDIAWLPILLIWFGFGLTTMTFVIVYTVLFPVVLNTVLGVRSVPLELHRAALSLGASKARVVWEVVLPGALPNIMTGLRNGLGFGWRALIAAELVGATTGLGQMIFGASEVHRSDIIIGGCLIIGAIAIAMDRWLLLPIERRTIERWGLVFDARKEN